MYNHVLVPFEQAAGLFVNTNWGYPRLPWVPRITFIIFNFRCSVVRRVLDSATDLGPGVMWAVRGDAETFLTRNYYGSVVASYFSEF
jgi:hypothetical protein